MSYTNSESNDWIEDEFSKVSLGDSRLNDRAIKIAKSFSANPQGSIPVNAGSWKDVHATYAFFSNAKVSADKILRCHIDSTLERASSYDVVLAVQDSTSFNLTGLKATDGLGEIGDSKNGDAKGLMVHNTYLMSDMGLPLGSIGQDIWDRKTSQFKCDIKCAKAPIEQKESFKWVQGMRQASSLTARLVNTHVIHVADREADIYDLFEEAKDLDESFIIRVKNDRCINKKSRASDDGEKLFKRLFQTKPIGKVELEVNDKSSHDGKRLATLSIRAIQFTLTPPRCKSIKYHNFKYKKVALTVMCVRENTDDESIDPINWMLVTNVKINTADEVLYSVRCYSHRWNIEVYHRILKTGCRVESIRFNSAHKIKTYAAFLATVAWHIHWMTLKARCSPDEKADIILNQEDQNLLKVLVLRKDRKPGRKKPFTVKECVLLLARLGGFLARKADGEPGAEVIWRGVTRLYEFKARLNTMLAAGFMTYV